MLVYALQHGPFPSSHIFSFSIISWIQCIRYMNDLEGAVQLHQTAWWETYNALIVSSFNTQSFILLV